MMLRDRYSACRALRGIGLLAIGISSLACEPSRAASDDSPSVALLLGTLQEERYQKDQEYFEKKAVSLGLKPFTLSADNDSARQLSQVEDALARGARTLVIQPTDSSSASSYVAKARQYGAKVIAYDRPIKGADAVAAHESVRIGRLQAEEALKATGGKGNYILLNGQSGSSVAEDIARGYREALRDAINAGLVKIVVEKSHAAWSPEQALKTVEDALTKTRGEVDAILANNSGLARGAVQAIFAAGLSQRKIFIAGADADAANVNFVCEGKQSIEILKDIRDLAESAAALAAQLSQGNAVTSSESWLGVPLFGSPVRLVTAHNVQSVLVDSGFHDERLLTACRARDAQNSSGK
jgi:D-xylose transport system substrate-binding protein